MNRGMWQTEFVSLRNPNNCNNLAIMLSKVNEGHSDQEQSEMLLVSDRLSTLCLANGSLPVRSWWIFKDTPVRYRAL